MLSVVTEQVMLSVVIEYDCSSTEHIQIDDYHDNIGDYETIKPCTFVTIYFSQNVYSMFCCIVLSPFSYITVNDKFSPVVKFYCTGDSKEVQSSYKTRSTNLFVICTYYSYRVYQCFVSI